jgi:hypothetical protein
MSNSVGSRMTWGRLRTAGVIGGVLVLVLVAVLVLVNVFAPPPTELEAAVEQAGVVGGQKVTDLDDLGLLSPPETDDPAVYGPLAAAALLTYDTSKADYFTAKEGIKRWLRDFETETSPNPFYDTPEETIYWSAFPTEEAYREQSLIEVVATAAVVGEPKVGSEHRDISPDIERSWIAASGLRVVTTNLDVTYEFTAPEGDRRTYVEQVTVTVEMNCGQDSNNERLTTNCVVLKYAREVLI